MVSAIEQGGQAWVEVHAGIDVNLGGAVASRDRPASHPTGIHTSQQQTRSQDLPWKVNFGLVLSSLGQGLPVLLLHFVVTLLLLVLGVACYTRITPFNEAHLVRGAISRRASC